MERLLEVQSSACSDDDTNDNAVQSHLLFLGAFISVFPLGRPLSSREHGSVGSSGHGAVPAARPAAQAHRHRRVQEQRESDLAAQRPRGRSRCHLLHHRGLQVSWELHEKGIFRVRQRHTHTHTKMYSRPFFTCFNKVRRSIPL